MCALLSGVIASDQQCKVSHPTCGFVACASYSQVVSCGISSLDRISWWDDTIHSGKMKSKWFSLSLLHIYNLPMFYFVLRSDLRKWCIKCGVLDKRCSMLGRLLYKPLLPRWVIGIIPYSSSHLTVIGVISDSEKNLKKKTTTFYLSNTKCILSASTLFLFQFPP